MINVAKLLENAPKGMKLYSPLFGEVEYMQLGDEDKIWVKTSCGTYYFDKNGKHCAFDKSECLLFPSKDCRTWEGWEPPVEPKFKVGDWIVQNDNGTVSQITKVINGTDEHGEYRAYEHTNGYFAECFENEYHLWSIADAKDGDVLMTTNIRNCPFIYRKTDYKNNLAYYYAGIDGNGNFCEGCLKRTLYHFGSVSDVAPATKEQFTLLFAKMLEAGYTWDEKKKKLRKIQHYDIANFKPYDKVLTRDTERGNWNVNLFSYYIDDEDERVIARFRCINSLWKQCIPFNNDTKHLLGTTDMCPEEYINW